jgi:non-heme chloroperoxidase
MRDNLPAFKHLVSSHRLLAPIIPVSPAPPEADPASIRGRLYGLLMLNALGIHGFDGLSVIAFSKPEMLWDGTETLSYAYRLNASYPPRYRYTEDLRALCDQTLVLVGANDEAVDGEALRGLFAGSAPGAHVEIKPNVNHFRIFSDSLALQTITDLLRAMPAS